MNIKEMKARRDELWGQLDALKADYEPKEREIRAEIKTLQETLYRAEMTPVMHMLQAKKSAGEISPQQELKLSMLEAKLNANDSQ